MSTEDASYPRVIEIRDFKLEARDIIDEWSMENMLIDDHVFRHMGRYRLPEDAVILDVGAFIGTFTLRAMEVCPRGVVIAFEPDFKNHLQLRQHVGWACEQLGVDKRRVIVRDTGLWKVDGVVLLNKYAERWGHSIKMPETGSGVQTAVEVITLATALKDIQRCHLLKLNIEGAEFDVIKNTTLDTWKKVDVVWCEVHKKFGDPEKLRRQLMLAGYEVNRVKENEELEWVTAFREGIEH